MRKVWGIVGLIKFIFYTVFWYSVFRIGSLFCPSSRKAKWRNRLVRSWASSMQRLIGLKITVEGEIPTPPFILISNHLSYLDIVCFMVTLDAVFVAKSDVEHWPGLGHVVKNVNTIFVARGGRNNITEANQKIIQNCNENHGIVFFPEGTTGEGLQVLPFRSRLFEPAVTNQMPVHSASMAYFTFSDAPKANQSVCWCSDAKFLPHLLGLLSLGTVFAQIRFGKVAQPENTRQALAKKSREHVLEIFSSSGHLSEKMERKFPK